MKLKEYELIANLAIEIPEENKNLFLELLTDNLITTVEFCQGFCGGGFELKDTNNE